MLRRAARLVTGQGCGQLVNCQCMSRLSLCMAASSTLTPMAAVGGTRWSKKKDRHGAVSFLRRTRLPRQPCFLSERRGYSVARLCRLAVHRHIDVDNDVGVQGDADRAVADGLDRPVRHADLGLCHLVALLAEFFGDIEVGD